MDIQAQTLTPNLMVENIIETIQFYEQFWFSLVMAVPDTMQGMDTEIDTQKTYVWAQIKNGSVEIMLQEETSLKEDVVVMKNMSIWASLTLYISVIGIDLLYTYISENHIKIAKDIHTTWYGMREVYIYDNNGYILCFGELIQQ